MHPLAIAALFSGAMLYLDKHEQKARSLQRQFEQFHDRIRLDDESEKSKLRAKRDLLVEELENDLKAQLPDFEWFHQGSYPMHTGVLPIDGIFDIDVGIQFACDRTAFPDPVLLKTKVRNALSRPGRTVHIRRSCVTVHYLRAGAAHYHVDLAVYAKRNDGMLDIAKGKENSAIKYRQWERCAPKDLTSKLCGRFRGANLQQYRRCIRYLKRWRDLQFSAGAPISIALTVAAYRWFQPEYTMFGRPQDIDALANWVGAMLAQFRPVAGYAEPRMQVFLPVEPKSDLMGRMTQPQMAIFRTKLAALHECLTAARSAKPPDETLAFLTAAFGEDFPRDVATSASTKG